MSGFVAKPRRGMVWGPEGRQIDSGLLGFTQLNKDDPNARAYKFYPGLTKENATSHNIEPMLGWAHKDDVGDMGYTGYSGLRGNIRDTGITGYSSYFTDGMNIRNPENSQHYRYKWVKDKEKEYEDSINRDVEKLAKMYESGSINGFELNKKIKDLKDKFSEDMQKLLRISDHGYDVPWHVDLLNPRGW